MIGNVITFCSEQREPKMCRNIFVLFIEMCIKTDKITRMIVFKQNEIVYIILTTNDSMYLVTLALFYKEQ